MSAFHDPITGPLPFSAKAAATLPCGFGARSCANKPFAFPGGRLSALPDVHQYVVPISSGSGGDRNMAGRLRASLHCTVALAIMALCAGQLTRAAGPDAASRRDNHPSI